MDKINCGMDIKNLPKAGRRKYYLDLIIYCYPYHQLMFPLIFSSLNVSSGSLLNTSCTLGEREMSSEDEFPVATMTRSIAKQMSADGNDPEFLEPPPRGAGRKNRKG